MIETAHRALALWDLGPATVRLAAHRENSVYHVSGAGADYALRLHRQGYHDDAELLSELQWMAALQLAGVSVPRPILARGGTYIETIDGVQADVLTWLSGRPLGSSGVPLVIGNRLDVFRNLGREMALLHEVTDAWPLPEGFTRKSWDAQGLVGDDPLWGRFWEHPGLTAAERTLFTDVRKRASGILRDCGGLDFGLIHADLVRENVIVDGGSIRFIDFDDSGFGFRLFEIATALIKNMSEPDFPALSEALLSGYRAERAIDTGLLPLFLVLRALTYVGWIITRMDEPGARARSARFVMQATQMAREYLAS